MSNIKEVYETRLETSELENISAVLDAKLEATSANRVTDYVAFAMDNLDDQIKRMKDAKKELDSMIKINESQKDIIKAGVSKWMGESGVEKLSGDIVSSMKITQPKAKETVKVLDEEALINQGYFKSTVDKTAVKAALLGGVEVEGAEIEIEHQSESLTIYKRRAK